LAEYEVMWFWAPHSRGRLQRPERGEQLFNAPRNSRTVWLRSTKFGTVIYLGLLWGQLHHLLREWGPQRGGEIFLLFVQPWATCASVTKQYNLVPANGRWWLAAGKVTVGLASHWTHVTDISGSPPKGSRPRRGRWTPTYTLLVEYGELCLLCTITPFDVELLNLSQ